MGEKTVVMRTPWDTAEYAITGDADDRSVIGCIEDQEGHYEPDVLIHLQRAVSDGDVVIDVGANVGALAVVLSRLTPNGRVIAFEPSPESCRYLKRNLAAAGAANVTVVCAAAGAAAGVASLRYDGAFAGGAHLASDDAADERIGEDEHVDVVEVVALDDWLDANGIDHVDLLKVDVEGHEMAALLGAQRMLDRDRPELVIEVNPVAHHRAHGGDPLAVYEAVRRRYRWVSWIREDGACSLLLSRRHLERTLLAKGHVDLFCTDRLRRPTAGPKHVTAIRAARHWLASRRAAGAARCPDRSFAVFPGVSLAVDGLPESVGAGRRLDLSVHVENRSPAWLSSGFRIHPITIGFRWLLADGSVQEAEARSLLPGPIPPRGSGRFTTSTEAPVQPGAHRLQVAVVQEHVAWLTDVDPRAGCTATVRVTEAETS